MGRSPTGTMGLGRYSVSSRKRVPRPPHKMTTFITRSYKAACAVQEGACRFGRRGGRFTRLPMMNPPARLSPTSRIDLLNVALMLGSAAVAIYVPFQLFLFSYAVLGPLHYLTEISWLHERNYFTKGRRDYWVLAGLALAVIVSRMFFDKPELRNTVFAVSIFVAFFGSVAMIATRSPLVRFMVFILVLLLAATAPSIRLFLLIFLPTLVHIYVFTGLFMLHGALRNRNWTGYLAFAVFLLCPLAFVWIAPRIAAPSSYTIHEYTRFAGLNFAVLSIGRPGSIWDAAFLEKLIPDFFSAQGMMIMRFIAFAYTYHYLNWFSKTSIIRWHRVSKRRLALLLVLWLSAVGLYVYDYSLGFSVLFGLGLLHVMLEFPLNHASMVGIFRELRGRVKGKAVVGRSMEQAG